MSFDYKYASKWFFGAVFCACIIIIALTQQSRTAHATPNIEVYPGPGGNAYISNLYTVEVFNGTTWESSYVYKFGRTNVIPWHQGTTTTVSFTTFGTDSSVNVRVTKIGGSITSAEISPKSKNISATITSGQATFTLNPNDKTWIILNGDDSNSLFVFADLPKPAVPAGATYFGPGVYDIATSTSNHYHPANNETVYIDGGAWVRGNIDIRGKTNVHIMGPGVLSGDLWTSEVIQALPTFDQVVDYAMVRGDWGGNNGTVEGITIVDSPTYNFFAGTNSATNVKLLSPWYYSTDGFQAVNHVDQVFAFVGDNVFFPIWAGIGNDNVTVTNSFAGTTGNSVFCGGFWGNEASNTYISFADNVDIKTYNSDAWVQFGAPMTAAAFQIWVDNNDSTRGYSNQTYQNIRIEGNLDVPLAIIKNRVYPWGGATAYDPPLGNSNKLVFKNIILEGTQKYLSELKGYDASNGFHNVVLENLSINGNVVTPGNISSYFDVNSYVSPLYYAVPIATTSLTASPSTINFASSSTLSWTSASATTVSINQGIGEVGLSGSLVVSPTTTTTYIITASNVFNSATSSATVTVIPDTQAPSVSITSPANNSQVDRNTNVTISANASDNVAVLSVQFYVNNALTCTDTTAPYSCVWSVPNPPKKTYVLVAKAFDTSGNFASSTPVTVTSK